MFNLRIYFVTSLFSTFTFLVLAAPTTKFLKDSQSIKLERRSINVKNMDSEERYNKLIDSILHTNQKYGVQIAEEEVGLEINLSKRGTNSKTVQLGAIPHDYGYYGKISIGNPSVDYDVLMDTGSADLVMLASPCLSGCLPENKLYDANNSSTSKLISSDYSIKYGIGSASGSVQSDSFSFAGMTLPSNYKFAAVTNAVHISDTISTSGIAGLAWSSLSSFGMTPFLQQFWLNGELANPVFGFALNDIGQDSVVDTYGGVMHVGFTDTSLYTGNLNYVPSRSKTYWDIPLDNIIANGLSLDISAPRAIIDTGTSYMYIPKIAADKIYATIPNSKSLKTGLYTYPCSTSVKVQLTFGGITYTISNEIFNLGVADSTGTTCYGAISSIGPGPNGENQFVIGIVFLQNVYVAFRFNPPSVGFGTLIGTTSTGTQTVTSSVPESDTPTSTNSNTNVINSPPVVVVNSLPIVVTNGINPIPVVITNGINPIPIIVTNGINSLPVAVSKAPPATTISVFQKVQDALYAEISAAVLRTAALIKSLVRA